MSQNLTFLESFKIIDSAIQKGQSIIELIQTSTGITCQHLAVLSDELLTKLRHTTYELMKVKNTPPDDVHNPIDRSLSQSLVLFLYELDKHGGDQHYNDIREKVKSRYGLTVNDYSALSFWRLIEKSKTGNGYWKITERGIMFLTNKLKLAEKLTIQNKKVIKASSRLVKVNDFIDMKIYGVSDRLIEKRKDGLTML